MNNTNFYKRLDGTILLILFAFFIISVIFIYSSQQTGEYGSQNLAIKQGINYIIGFVLLIAVAKLDVNQIERLAWPSYIALFKTSPNFNAEISKEASTTDKAKLECSDRLPNIETKTSHIWRDKLLQNHKYDGSDETN